MKIKTYTVPSTQKANVVERCDGLNFYIPKCKDGTNGVTPHVTVGTTTTLPAGTQATVTETGTIENPILNFGIPQGEKGASCGNTVPLNFFDGWTANITTTQINQPIILPTSITHTTTDGISYNKTTGIVGITRGWWRIEYNFTAVSQTAQTLSMVMSYNGTNEPVSVLTQPLLANQPQSISRSFVISSNGPANLSLICQTSGIVLSQINWYIIMLED